MNHVIVGIVIAGTLTAALVMLAFTLGWVVSRREFREMRADRDSWRNMALTQLSATREQRATTRQAVETIRDLATTPPARADVGPPGPSIPDRPRTDG